MNRTLAVVVALTFSCGGKPRDLTCEAVTGLPVFPGAEGYGTNTPGGRGGKVIEVTSLANAGAGSFREAVSAKGPRIVVFRVAGIITLESQLDVREPFLTVAGQTAPGQGVFINGAGLTVFTHDVVLQHLRVRPGEFPFTLAQDNDAKLPAAVETFTVPAPAGTLSTAPTLMPAAPVLPALPGVTPPAPAKP